MDSETFPSNTYIGQKGYTISKKDLTAKQIDFIKTELFAKPFTPGAPVNTSTGFKVYRESVNKYYLPRCFGEKHFGPPHEIKISNGDDVYLDFNGQLRENQEVPVNTYLDMVKKTEGGCGLLDLPCGFGKTSLSLYILSKLKKKTLVLVHKEFLFNQWIERIQQFLPEARIGKIQGPTIDIENKDIVLGMIQSISMKDYDLSVFSSFGFTIIDEVHHISSEVFSNTLFKLVTKYMLGLSATMNRKDGTTKVFKMFLGDVVFKETKKQDHNVVVRALEFETSDDDFNEMVYDYRGNPQFSTMITKLCDYNRRSEFILQVVKDMLEENPNQQIMILGQYKKILKYLFDAITKREIGTIGYYIGGMKESALKESETKKIILGTYAMAAEGLDIKTLTTLIMVTPKTDIEQSVGRILRVKHGSPVVVDIVDKHDIFQKQWKKREVFYRKNNYEIIYTSNLTYTKDVTKWKVLEKISKSKSKSDSKNNSYGEQSGPGRKNSEIPTGVCLIKL